MNLRRYALFLLVALLTFVIGVTAAVLVGHVSPFPHRHEGRRRCGRFAALPDSRTKMTVYTVYRLDGTIVKSYEVDKTYGLERIGPMTDEAAPPAPPVITDLPRATK
jgi:hypothetical protein